MSMTYHHSERSNVRRKPRQPRLEVMQRRRRDDLLLQENYNNVRHPNRGRR